MVMNNKRERITLLDPTNSLSASTRRDMILQQLMGDNKPWLDECLRAPCITAFITRQCHYSQMQSGDQRLIDSIPRNSARRRMKHVFHRTCRSMMELSNLSIDDGSQAACSVSLALQDRKSENTGWTTERRPLMSKGRRSSQATVDKGADVQPSCGRIRARATEQTSDRPSIRSSQSQCLGSICHSNDSVRYFRPTQLVHTDSYLFVYDFNNCVYEDAAQDIVEYFDAVRPLPLTQISTRSDRELKLLRN